MSPATLAGALVQQNAEVLAGFTLIQTVRRGCLALYGNFATNVDLRSGAPAFGTPEHAKCTHAAGQMARHYGVPFRSSNTTGSNAVDTQATYENAMSLWGTVMDPAFEEELADYVAFIKFVFNCVACSRYTGLR